MSAKTAFPAIVLAAALVYGWVAWNYPAMPLHRGFGPGFYPVIIAALVAFLAAIETTRQIYALRRAADGEPANEDHVRFDRRGLACAAILTAGVIAMALAVRPLGFVVASAGLVTVLTMLMGTRSLWQALAFGLLASGAIYLVFAKGFGVVLAF